MPSTLLVRTHEGSAGLISARADSSFWVSRPMIQGTPFPISFANDPKRSLAEQAQIADVLDKFDTLTTSLAEGLPREIALRNAQYEHYRNLLLGFPKGDKA